MRVIEHTQPSHLLGLELDGRRTLINPTKAVAAARSRK